MKNYIDKNKNVYSYEDNTPKEFLDAKIKELGLTPISDEALSELRKPSLEDLKISKCQEVNIDTKNNIIKVAGSLEQQANYNSEYTELLGKKIDGTLTEDEIAFMTKIKDGWIEVKRLIKVGNDLEIKINSAKTIEDLDW